MEGKGEAQVREAEWIGWTKWGRRGREPCHRYEGRLPMGFKLRMNRRGGKNFGNLTRIVFSNLTLSFPKSR